MGDETDLFGNPVRKGAGMRGRPPFAPTEKEHNKVRLLLALGWAAQRIANALAISPATLKRYFRAELRERDAMRDRLEARRLEVAADKALAGDVSGMREFARMIDRNDRFAEDSRLVAAQDTVQGTAARIGKKEQARRDAEAAGTGTEWGSDLLPGLPH